MRKLLRRVGAAAAVLTAMTTFSMVSATPAHAGPCNNGWYPGCVWYLN